jgi:hypothetical protein
MSGSEGGLGKQTSRKADTAPQVDPYSVFVVLPVALPSISKKGRWLCAV